ncbi:hypothetical protein TNCV_4038561 [Trichonephila clavipes]|nr:hypothetical protein TNCV_4038561 [Trichonephila clavipes]
MSKGEVGIKSNPVDISSASVSSASSCVRSQTFSARPPDPSSTTPAFPSGNPSFWIVPPNERGVSGSKSSLWRGVEAWRMGCQLGCRPPHLADAQDLKDCRQEPSFSHGHLSRYHTLHIAIPHQSTDLTCIRPNLHGGSSATRNHDLTETRVQHHEFGFISLDYDSEL